ncbi:cytidine deaminase [Sodiomyces alkalinus F11]|uniref:Cytidine deaminase n=1 Tax=Sodiomyces alkalinus (strain CBS 110278 / VKM F-3762 / F11) TaxID=1314773 RepID=A0A3N2PS13_SODAK|nr:cytidine deaminase [Sodiomyces alkalinus F11]ROT37297.1 cytidine deaminase [Sodiomyces alkalinus F11]
MAAIKTYSIQNPSHREETVKKYGLTENELLTLHERSVAAKSRAYCPYSKFRVGATLLSNNGQWIDGANVENASYGIGTCAERVALGKAVTEGIRSFKAVGVAADIEATCSPCGACRQFIREFCDLETPIFMFNIKGEYATMTISELLPLSFGPDVLPSPEVLEANRPQT